MITGTVRKNVLLLAASQALFMTSTSAIIATAPIVGGMLLSQDKALATLPIALQFVSMALTTIPASLYMGRVGRKIGFITGTGIGAIGGLTGAYAIMTGSFALFCLACMLVGSFNGFCHYFRFAAADSAPLDYRSRAISYVLAGSVVAAFLGPMLARNTAGLLPASFAGVFLSLIVVYALIACIISFIDVPLPPRKERNKRGRPLLEIAVQPKFIIAVCAATFGYLVMSFLMTVTPLAMQDCGFSFSDSSYVIQAHVLGMFVPAFFTGHLIARFGVYKVLIAGVLLNLCCIAINLTGTDFLNFVSALLLVGVGWNFLFTAGTALVTETYAPEEKAKVQGLNDFVIWGTISVGSVAAGVVQHAVGWAAVNMIMAPLVIVVLVTTLWLRMNANRKPAEHPVA